MSTNLIVLVFVLIGLLVISGCVNEKQLSTKRVIVSEKKISTVSASACESKLNGRVQEISDERSGLSRTTQVCLPYDEDLIKCLPDSVDGCWTRTACQKVGGVFCPSEESGDRANSVTCFNPKVAPCAPKEAKDETKESCDLSGGSWDSQNSFCKEAESVKQEYIENKQPSLLSEPKLVLNWGFEEEGPEVKDSSNDPAKSGSLVGFSDPGNARVSGVSGHTAIKLDGIGSQIKSNNPVQIGPDFTVSLLVRTPKAMPDKEQEIAAMKGQADYKIFLGPNGLGFSADGKKIYAQIDGGKWVNVLVVSRSSENGQKITLYLNGENKISDSYSNQKSGAVNIVLGGADPEYKYFKGTIDDFRLYDSAISEQAIKGLSKSYGNNAEIILNWKMDEAAGDRINDISGFENTGLLSGTSWTKGISKGGIRFDGSTSYIAADELLLSDKDSFAVSLYVKIPKDQKTATGFPDQDQSIMQIHGQKKGGESNTKVVLGNQGLGIVWKTSDSAEQIYASQLPFDQWVNVKAVWKKTADNEVTASLYLNGNIQGSKKSNLLKSSEFYPVVGASSRGNFFKGEVDEIKVYSGSDTGSNRCKTDSDCETREKCKTENNICVQKPTCKKTVDSGDPKNKLDLVFVYDGETQESDLQKKIESLVNYNGDKPQVGLFSIEPFKANKAKFNVWIIPSDKKILQSPDQMSSIPSNTETISNILATQCSNVEYGIVLSPQNFRSFSLKNTIFLSETYGGQAVATKIGNRLAHELGHSIFGLADEYAEAGKDKKPRKPNCAPDKETAKKWWGELENKEGIGYFGGCSYTDDNFRSTSNSVMRDVQMENPSFGLVSSKYMLYMMERYKA